ncbi:hypothetical protein A2U01_0069961, partial [Trifolium medium]|nr:hypothetical protein [Trifolium medium]
MTPLIFYLLESQLKYNCLMIATSVVATKRADVNLTFTESSIVPK